MRHPDWHIYEAYLEELVSGWKGWAEQRDLVPHQGPELADVETLKADAIEALHRAAGPPKAEAGQVSYLPMKSWRADAATRPRLFLVIRDKRSFVLSSTPLPWLSPRELPPPRVMHRS